MEYSGLPSSVKRAIVDGSDERRLRELLLASDYKTMRERAADLIAEGLTDDAEVCRVLGHPDAIEGEA
jgi:type II secretory ATPase GspE/PulE/Tfp pilus assembly ATPase PilB-like protein